MNQVKNLYRITNGSEIRRRIIGNGYNSVPIFAKAIGQNKTTFAMKIYGVVPVNKDFLRLLRDNRIIAKTTEIKHRRILNENSTR